MGISDHRQCVQGGFVLVVQAWPLLLATDFLTHDPATTLTQPRSPEAPSNTNMCLLTFSTECSCRDLLSASMRMLRELVCLEPPISP